MMFYSFTERTQRLILLMILFALALPMSAFALDDPIPLHFEDLAASKVLKAIALQTGASIVYSVTGSQQTVTQTTPGAPNATTGSTAIPKNDRPITINITAHSVEEAVRAVAAAAGLRYRKVGDVYIVADNMRVALAPFAMRTEFTVPSDAGSAAARVMAALPSSLVGKTTIDYDPATKVQTTKSNVELVPDADVLADSGKVYVTGVPEDIATAKRIIQEFSKTQGLYRQVLELQAAEPKDAQTAIQAALPALKCTIVPSSDKNHGKGSLVVVGTEGDIEAARVLLANVDRPLEQVAYRVYKIKYSSAPSLIEFLKSAVPTVECTPGPEAYSPIPPRFNPLSGQGLSSSGTGTNGSNGANGSNSGGSFSSGADVDIAQEPYKPTDRAKSIVIRGTQSSVDEALLLLDQVDVKPEQVAIQVQVLDTTPEVTSQIGFTWDWTRFGFYENQPGTEIKRDPGAGRQEATDFLTRPLNLFGRLSRVPWTFQSILQASIAHNDTKVIASPNLLVTDNDQANVFIGDTARIEVQSSGALGAANQNIITIPVGIVMLLRPRVNTDGNITMRIHPVVSTITSISQGLPQTSEREADTTVVAKDGETIVLGGLIRDEDTKSVSEVPILGQLPIVGLLFRNRTHDHVKKEVLIFITAHIVKEGEPTPNPFGPKDLHKNTSDKLGGS